MGSGECRTDEEVTQPASTIAFGSDMWLLCGALRDAMDDKASEVDDEEMVRVPEDLEIAPADEFHGGGDHEDQRHGDDHARQAWDGSECHICWSLQGNAARWGWSQQVAQNEAMMPSGSQPGSHIPQGRPGTLTVLLEWMGFSHLLLSLSWCRSERMEERLPSAACWLSLYHSKLHRWAMM